MPNECLDVGEAQSLVAPYKLLTKQWLQLLLVAGCCLVGCANSNPYSAGKGDLGAFILATAKARGAQFELKQDLPQLNPKWGYAEDENGVVIVTSPSSFPMVEAFLLKAFGPPAEPAGATTDGGKLGW